MERRDKPGPVRAAGSQAQGIEVNGEHGVPSNLAVRAVRSGSGEYAWVRQDAIACTEALAGAGQAVLGGEVWLVDEEGDIRALLPAKDGSPPGVYHWEVLPGWEPNTETWLEFCRRAAAYTVSVLRQMDIEHVLANELWEQVRYNLTWVSEDWYTTRDQPRL